jgi:Lrp/AsnC family leucine-responsive transcriptional regulator
MKLDRIDEQILSLLQEDAKSSQARIGKEVGLSAPAVNERIRKLEEGGAIRKYVALVDPRQVGLDITAFIEVFVEHPRFEKEFIGSIQDLAEVQECHHITGEFSLLLKVRTADVEGLRKLLMERINSVQGVRQTRTLVVLETSKEETKVRIP